MPDRKARERQRRYLLRKQAEGQASWHVSLSAEINAAGQTLMNKHPDLFPNKSETLRKALLHLCSAYGIDDEGQGMLFAPGPSELDQSSGKEAANGS